MASTYSFRLTAEGWDQFARQVGELAKQSPLAAQAFERLRAASPALATAMEAAEQRVQRTTEALRQHAVANDNAEQSQRRLSAAIQQGGYQVGDFFTQIASGQSALVAFAQQGGQLLQFFGTGGIIASVALTGAAVVARFLEMGDSAEDAAKRTEANWRGVKEGQEQLGKAIEEVNKLWRSQAENAVTAAEAARKAQGSILAYSADQLVQRNEGNALELVQAQKALADLDASVARRQEQAIAGIASRMGTGAQRGTDTVLRIGPSIVDSDRPEEIARRRFEITARIDGLQADIGRVSQRLTEVQTAQRLLATAPPPGAEEYGPTMEEFRAGQRTLREQATAARRGAAAGARDARQVQSDAIALQNSWESFWDKAEERSEDRIEKEAEKRQKELERDEQRRQQSFDRTAERYSQMLSVGVTDAIFDGFKNGETAAQTLASALQRALRTGIASVLDAEVFRPLISSLFNGLGFTGTTAGGVTTGAVGGGNATSSGFGGGGIWSLLGLSGLGRQVGGFLGFGSSGSSGAISSPSLSSLARFPGLIEAGNIDLTSRPRVLNSDGSISTVRSLGVNIDGREVLIPTVSDDGRILSDDEAIRQFEASGRHLGVFSSPQASTAYAEALHQQQANMYTGGGGFLNNLFGGGGGLSGLWNAPLWTSAAASQATAALPAGVAGPVAAASDGVGVTSLSSIFGGVGSSIGSIGLGFGLGSAAGGLVAGARGTQGPGNLIGAGAGALAGAIFGPIGALIGGLIGGIGGAFFGPTKKGMEARSGVQADYGVGPDGRLVINRIGGKRYDTEGFEQHVQEQLDQINQAIADRGLIFTGSAQLSVGAGKAAGGLSSDVDPNRFSAYLRSASGDDTVNRLLRASTDRTGSDFNAALEDVDFYNKIYQPLLAATQVSDDLAAAINQVNEKFSATIDRAGQLGLATDQLTAAREREIQQLRDAKTREALTQEGQGLSTILAQQNNLFSLIDSIDAVTGSPQSRLTTAQSAFNRAVQAARVAGVGRADTGAVNAAGQAVVAAAREFYGTGGQYGPLASWVRSTAVGLGADFQIPAFGGNLELSLAAATAPLADEMGALRAEVASLRDELRAARLRVA